MKRIDILEKEEDDGEDVTDLDTAEEENYDQEEDVEPTSAASPGGKSWGLDFACQKGENIMRTEKAKTVEKRVQKKMQEVPSLQLKSMAQKIKWTAEKIKENMDEERCQTQQSGGTL